MINSHACKLEDREGIYQTWITSGCTDNKPHIKELGQIFSQNPGSSVISLLCIGYIRIIFSPQLHSQH
jgi:hypothetical protein